MKLDGPLGQLPVVLLSKIFEFVDHETLHHIEQTCRALYAATHDPSSDAWRQMVRSTAFLDERLWRAQGDGSSAACWKWKSLACAVHKSRALSSSCSPSPQHDQHHPTCSEEHTIMHPLLPPDQEHHQQHHQTAHRAGSITKSLLHSVLDCTSADRPSETAENTLHLSNCWLEIQKYRHTSHLNHPFLSREHGFLNISIGERIQLKCGCSSGNSCYWSSSSSTSANAMECIDYEVKSPCIVQTVDLLPYRVYWHPGSPTYGPKQVSFEFFHDEPCWQQQEPGDQRQLRQFLRTSLYKSAIFDVINDMQMQRFRFERDKCVVLVKGSNPLARNVLRVRMYGRQQQQTFVLPPWLQRLPEDQLPKYYVCLSYVGASGLVYPADKQQEHEQHQYQQHEPEQEQDQDQVDPTRRRIWRHDVAPWY